MKIKKLLIPVILLSLATQTDICSLLPFKSTAIFSDISEDINITEDTQMRQPSVNADNIYKDILDMFYENISTEWESYTNNSILFNGVDEKNTQNISYMWYRYNKNTPLSQTGYKIIDIDKDGTDELIVGTINEYDGSMNVFDIYTIYDGKAVHIVSGGERITFSITDNNMVKVNGSSSASSSSITYYTIENGLLTAVEEYKFDSSENPENPYFYSDTVMSSTLYSDGECYYNFGNYVNITASEYNNQMSNKSLFDFTLFSNYSLTSTTTTTTKLTTTTISTTTTTTEPTTTTTTSTTISTEGVESELNGFTQNEVDNSAIKPHIYVESKLITLDEKSNRQSVNIMVSGATFKYSSTGLRIYYDPRLTLCKTDIGLLDVVAGDALQYLSLKTPKEDLTAEDWGMKGVFVAATAKSDIGLDGITYTLTFELPEDAAVGDVFPIDIVYKSDSAYECSFTNAMNDNTGKLMQAYAFTRGINNGITSSFDAETAVDAEALEKCPNILNVDPATDGIAAIIDKSIQTTTLLTTTTTTTTSTTTTTTEPINRITLGDVNDYGMIDANDASAVLAEYAAASTNSPSLLSEAQKEAADVNNDGLIDASDASCILAYYSYTSIGGTESLEGFMKLMETEPISPPVTEPLPPQTQPPIIIEPQPPVDNPGWVDPPAPVDPVVPEPEYSGGDVSEW